LFHAAQDTSIRVADATISAGWTVAAVENLFELPFNDLLYRAHNVHRAHFDPNAVQLSTLLSVKTGGCPEDCGYCPQAARYQTSVTNEDLLSVQEIDVEPIWDVKILQFFQVSAGEEDILVP